ncbi:MAG: FAD-binding oxidoreductase, partial [Candidatus Limnocylindria bacterium]
MEQPRNGRHHAPSSADVVVIGGGIIGCAAAAIMADRGAHVVLVEAATIGAGASGRNLGAIQHPFDPVLAVLYRESLARYRALADRTDSHFVMGASPAGLLLLNRDADAAAAQARRMADAFPELGAQLLSADEVHRLEPSLTPGPSAVRLATGYPIPPASATTAWASLAEQRGAVFVIGSPASPSFADGRVTGVTLDNGTPIAADAVLVAAGPRSPSLIDPSGTWHSIRATWGVTIQVRLDGRDPHHVVEEDEVGAVNRAAAATERAAHEMDPEADPPSLFSI